MAQTDLQLEITVDDVKCMLDDAEDFLLLDVREPEEHAMVHIEEARLLPLGELPRSLAQLRPHANRAIVVYCHMGGRSLQAAEFLRRSGFPNACSMAGGIEEWAVRIDPTKPRY